MAERRVGRVSREVRYELGMPQSVSRRLTSLLIDSASRELTWFPTVHMSVISARAPATDTFSSRDRQSAEVSRVTSVLVTAVTLLQAFANTLSDSCTR